MTQQPILIAGHWQQSNAVDHFQAVDPTTGRPLTERFPISDWHTCDSALAAASAAFSELQHIPRSAISAFLSLYADKIEQHASNLAEIAHLETGLPLKPRLIDIEIPRTTNQLRQGAVAALNAAWTQPTIDSKTNVRSMLEAIGPVVVFGPNNFPFAFGSVSGGDFVAAIVAGAPVIAKAHPCHPATTKALAQLAHDAAIASGLPAAMIQLIYALPNATGLQLVADPRLGATGFTGSRAGGLALKQAADQAGKPIYLELSSVNPVVILPGALAERATAISEEFSMSCMGAAGQLCTKPGLLIVPDGLAGDALVNMIAEKLKTGPVGTLLHGGAAKHLANASAALIDAGAELLMGGHLLEEARFCHANTLLSISGARFLKNSAILQQEMFGNASLIIRSQDTAQTIAIINQLEGNLTGCLYSHSNGSDDQAYDAIEPVLRQKVGRLINDKMPTGVLVSPAMNHGGPFPASGHPGFSAVGLPGSAKRFGALKCYDNVRQHRLPAVLQDKNPNPAIWRLIDGEWTTADLG